MTNTSQSTDPIVTDDWKTEQCLGALVAPDGILFAVFGSEDVRDRMIEMATERDLDGFADGIAMDRERVLDKVGIQAVLNTEKLLAADADAYFAMIEFCKRYDVKNGQIVERSAIQAA